jgi:hypothetical protein
MRKFLMIIIFSIILITIGCEKDKIDEPCKCAIVTDAGYNKFGVPQQRLVFCDGDTIIWLVPDSTWRLDPNGCWEKLQDIDSLKGAANLK